MNFNQLVFRNVIRNGRDYLTYFLSSLFSVMVFFIFSLLYFHPDLGDQLRASSADMSELANFGIKLAEIVIALMSFIFLWYAFNAFLQTRKSQLSIYLTLGMTEKKLKKMIIMENLVLGFSSILIGTIFSIVFSKLILLISQNILALDQGLPFYFPIKAILLTWAVYGVIFIFISMVTILKLRRMTLIEMKHKQEEIVTEPKKSISLAILGIASILVGYALAFSFAADIGPLGSSLFTLIACVLITILGTFLFFKYASVQLFHSLKKKKIFFKNGNMLTISNLMQRMRSNATMYFMISIVGAIAFVGIGVSKAVGGYEFGSTQSDSFSVVYSPYFGEDVSKEMVKYHETNIETVNNFIKEETSDFISLDLEELDVLIEVPEINGMLNYVTLSESTINKIMAYRGEELFDVPDGEIIKLAGTNSEVRDLKKNKMVGVKEATKVANYEDERTLDITLVYSDKQMSLSNYSSLAVVSDKTYEELKKFSPKNSATTHIYDFKDWQKYPELNTKIVSFLNEKRETKENNVDNYFKEIKKDPSDELTDSEMDGLMAIYDEDFNFNTMYKTWLDTKQKNGTILLISVLLGSVFFTFSCSIIYFKLFGELDQNGKYHRSLYILGVPEKRRRKMVTTEMLVMFFIPFVVSSLHFIAAMSALKVLIELPVYMYVGQILSVYIVFQILFFLICRRQYLKNLNKYAENIKR